MKKSFYCTEKDIPETFLSNSPVLEVMKLLVSTLLPQHKGVELSTTEG